MAVPPQEAGQVDLSAPAIAVGTQATSIRLRREACGYVFEGAPQPLDQDVILAALSSRLADLDLLCLRPGHEARRGELTALVGVEGLWLTAAFQHHLHSLQTELRVEAVRQLPAEHVPGEEIHDRHQVEKTLLERDVGDVGGPHLIHRCDRAGIQQAGKTLGWGTRNRGARFLVDLPDVTPFAGPVLLRAGG